MVKHVSYRGKVVDMELLKSQNQYKAAIGNAQLNARGDKIGRGGTVIKTREQLMQEREAALQVPDFIPVQNSSSTEYSTEWDDSQFNAFPDITESPQEAPAEVQTKKAAPRRTKKDSSNE
ncbi:hypothetical protein RCIP0023_00057 [Klebsiella phage RCIP0023]